MLQGGAASISSMHGPFKLLRCLSKSRIQARCTSALVAACVLHTVLGPQLGCKAVTSTVSVQHNA